MIKGLKICGVSDSDTLNYILNHPHPPKFIGFISNYIKSKRFSQNPTGRYLLTKKLQANHSPGCAGGGSSSTEDGFGGGY